MENETSNNYIYASYKDMKAAIIVNSLSIATVQRRVSRSAMRVINSYLNRKKVSQEDIDIVHEYYEHVYSGKELKEQ